MVRTKKGSLFIWVLLGSLLAAAPVLGEEPAVEAAPEIGFCSENVFRQLG